MNNFWSNKRILITGGAGFIGTHLANRLNAKGSKVKVIDNLERGNKKFLDKKIEFHKYDLRKYNENLKKIFKNIDIIFHLASKVGSMDYYLNNSYDVLNENLIIDNIVIDQAINSKIKTFFYASSAHVYPSENKLLKKKFYENDNFAYRPKISYGLAKMLTENKLFFAAKKFNFMKILVARYTGIYGPLQDYDINKASLIPAICFKAIGKKKNINLLTNGNEMRSYCFIDDAINCTMLMCEKNELNYDIYNVCSNHIETIKSIAKKVIKVSNSKKKLRLSKKKANVDYQFCSNDKAVNKLGWNCDTELMTGLSYTFRDIEKRVNYKK